MIRRTNKRSKKNSIEFWESETNKWCVEDFLFECCVASEECTLHVISCKRQKQKHV